MVLIHTRWSSDIFGSRADEVAYLPEYLDWMDGFLDEKDIIIAGDLNYDGRHANLVAMQEATGFEPVDPNEKTTFKGNYTGYASAYDHIYVPTDTFQREWIPDRTGSWTPRC